jgi:hypothetical protein
VHSRLLVITESLLKKPAFAAPTLKRRGSSELNPQDVSVDHSYEICDAVVALSDILAVERTGYMELVSESLAKLKAHSTDDSRSAEFSAVYVNPSIARASELLFCGGSGQNLGRERSEQEEGGAAAVAGTLPPP